MLAGSKVHIYCISISYMHNVDISLNLLKKLLRYGGRFVACRIPVFSGRKGEKNIIFSRDGSIWRTKHQTRIIVFEVSRSKTKKKCSSRVFCLICTHSRGDVLHFRPQWIKCCFEFAPKHVCCLIV